MRILVLSQLVPFPLDSGAKIRLYYTLRHLERRHSLHLLAFSRQSDSDLSHLRDLCERVDTVPIRRSRLRDVRLALRAAVRRRSFLMLRDLQERMFSALKRVVEREGPFDAVHADQLWMAPYAIRAQAHQKAPLLKVLDRHNALFRVLEELHRGMRNPVRRLWLGQEKVLLRREEARLMQGFDQIVWVSEKDRQSFWPKAESSHDSHPVTHLIPIAIEPRSSFERSDRPFRITFVGGLHWPPNRQAVEWFAERVWPLLSRRHPATVFTVIGAQASKLSRKARRGPGVEIAGYQPDLDRYLAETAVFVVPLFSGSGTRVKILEAWNHGLPVVSTTIGAEGLEAVPDKNLLLADSGEDFLEAVSGLLTTPRRARDLARSGRETVCKLYDWRHNYSAWDQLYDENTFSNTLFAEPDPCSPL